MNCHAPGPAVACCSLLSLFRPVGLMDGKVIRQSSIPSAAGQLPYSSSCGRGTLIGPAGPALAAEEANLCDGDIGNIHRGTKCELTAMTCEDDEHTRMDEHAEHAEYDEDVVQG